MIFNNVFSVEWCSNFIKKYDHELEPSAVGKDHYGRHDFVDRALARYLHTELTKYIDLRDFKINHRFYMSKYLPHTCMINKHVDGHITDSDGRCSAYTILIYLNACEGGQTVLYDTVYTATVQTQPGRVLFLKQDIVHEGLCPVDTLKYILRTDLMQLR